MSESRLRVALRNDYEVVIRGLEAMLDPFADRVELVIPPTPGSPTPEVDVTLYDTFSQPQVDFIEVDLMLAEPTSGAVVIYTWNMDPAVADEAIAKGCRGYVDKAYTAPELVTVLERIHAGATVVTSARSGEDDDHYDGSWPGRAEGLSAREAEVVALITQGLTNTDIAARSYLSINSVKSYIRSAYRKMGVARRSQAVRWGIEHGMLRSSASRNPAGE